MTDTMTGHEIPQTTVQDYDLTAQTRSVIVLVTGVTSTKARTLREYGTKIVTGTGTIVHLVIVTELETLIDEVAIMIEDQQKKSLREWETGRSTLAHQGKSTTTIANRKFLSGRSLATGSTGRRIENEKSVTGTDTDGTETVTVIESTTDLTHLGRKMGLRRDIPVLLDLVRTATTAATVVGTPIHHDRTKIETTTEIIISHSNLFPSRRSPEDIAMVIKFLQKTRYGLVNMYSTIFRTTEPGYGHLAGR